MGSIIVICARCTSPLMMSYHKSTLKTCMISPLNSQQMVFVHSNDVKRLAGHCSSSTTTFLPQIRFWARNVLCLGVIPGPNKLMDFDSFFWPAMEEFLKLACGVQAFDLLEQKHFWLHAYLIICFGDIPAMSMVMRMKGHNGLLPCRMCQIHGLRIPDICNPVHYVPLHRSHHPSVRADANAVKNYNPTALPL